MTKTEAVMHLVDCLEVGPAQPGTALAAPHNLHLIKCLEVGPAQPGTALAAPHNLHLIKCLEVGPAQPGTALAAPHILHLILTGSSHIDSNIPGNGISSLAPSTWLKAATQKHLITAY